MSRPRKRASRASLTEQDVEISTASALTKEQEGILQIRRNNGVAEDLVEELARGKSSVQNTVQELKDSLANSLQILSDELYSKPAHFVLETIQNADDNTYPPDVVAELRIVLRPSYMEIQCNEVGFSAANVKAFCGIGKSTKKNKAGYIGEKGIGAKAMFKVANKVHVHSLGYHFVLDREEELGMISPQWSPEILNQPGWTLMRLDFCDQNQFAVVKAQLRHVRDTVLIFMRRLCRISIDDGEKFKVSCSFDGDICTILTTIGGVKSRQPYLRVARLVSAFPDEPKRENVDTTEVVLAFPLNEVLKPVISNQMVHAFLPMRAVGFKFIIQADFLTAANREDVLSDLQWNKKLREGICETFCDALADFKAMKSLEKNWLLFLPDKNDVVDPFFSQLSADILASLRTMDVVKCADGHYRTPSAVRFPSVFSHEGKGLIPENQLSFHYVSPNYPSNTTAKLRMLGVQNMTFADFLGGLCRMGNAITLRGNDWLEEVCGLMTSHGFTWRQRVGEQLNDSRVRKLPIAQLADGSWVNCERPGSLFFSGDSSRFPSGLGIDVLQIDSDSPRRKQLLSKLGIAVIDVNVVAKKIVELHRTNMTLTVARALQHVLYIYKNRHSILKEPISVYSLWLPDTGGQLLRGNELYMDDPRLPAISKLLEAPARFLHPDFVSPPTFNSDEQHLKEWHRWLQSTLCVSTVPKVPSGRPAPEFIDLISRLQISNRTARLLSLLRQFWPGINAQLVQTHHATAFSEFMGDLEVRCQNGRNATLRSTFVPNHRIAPFATNDMPQLPIPQADLDKDWSFLCTFGVSVDVDAAFFLKRLLALSKSKSAKKEQVEPLYKQLEARFHEIPTEIRNAFQTHSVFLASKRWFSQRDVVWDGPNILTLKTSLKLRYPGLETLFRQHLAIPDAKPAIIADELKAFAESHEGRSLSPEESERLIGLLSYAAQTIALVKAGTCPDWTTSVRKDAIFPVARTAAGKVRLFAQTKKFYLTDPSGQLKQLFDGKTWFLAISPERLVDLHPLIDHIGLQKKRIDTRVRATVRINGDTVDEDTEFGVYDARETKAYQKKVRYFQRLQRYKAKQKDKALVNSISVYKVDNIEITYELDNDEVQPISQKRACWSRGDDKGNIELFFASSCSQKERRANCEQEMSIALGLSEDGALAVSAIIRTEDDEEMNNTLKNAGIHELVEQPPQPEESDSDPEGEDIEMAEADHDDAAPAPRPPAEPEAEVDELDEEEYEHQPRQSRRGKPAVKGEHHPPPYPLDGDEDVQMDGAGQAAEEEVDVVESQPTARGRRKSRRESNVQTAPSAARARAPTPPRAETPPPALPAPPAGVDDLDAYLETEQGHEEIERVTRAAAHAWLPQVTPAAERSFAEPAGHNEEAEEPPDGREPRTLRRRTTGGASLSGIAVSRRGGRRAQSDAHVQGARARPHPSDDARTKRIGFLGERFVFELLKHHLKDCSPAFDYENWTSPFRVLAGHPEFEGQELADFVYHDKSGTLTKHLFSRGSEYYKAAPEYFIEVKATSGEQSEPFHMKRRQFLQAMQLSQAARQPGDSLQLYVLFRVNGVGGEDAPVLKAYVDPHDMLSRGTLRVESECVEMRVVEVE